MRTHHLLVCFGRGVFYLAVIAAFLFERAVVGLLGALGVVFPLGWFGEASTLTVVFFEYVGDGGEADVVLLDQFGHPHLLNIVKPCHHILNLNNKFPTSSLIFR
jgi:hypothetical protein